MEVEGETGQVASIPVFVVGLNVKLCPWTIILPLRALVWLRWEVELMVMGEEEEEVTTEVGEVITTGEDINMEDIIITEDIITVEEVIIMEEVIAITEDTTVLPTLCTS